MLEQTSYLNAGTEGPCRRQPPRRSTTGSTLELTQGRCGPVYFEALKALAAQLRAAYAQVLGADAGGASR